MAMMFVMAAAHDKLDAAAATSIGTDENECSHLFHRGNMTCYLPEVGTLRCLDQAIDLLQKFAYNDMPPKFDSTTRRKATP